MKKLLTLFCAGALIGALGTACNNGDGQGQDKENENEIQVVPVSDDIAESVEQIARFVRIPPPDGQTNRYFNGCVIINSLNELPKVDYQGNPLELPDIDFASYTLIVGQCMLAHSGIYIASQNVIAEDGVATINIILKHKKGEDEHYEQHPELSHFWGLYPKITTESINMNVTVKN